MFSRRSTIITHYQLHGLIFFLVHHPSLQAIYSNNHKKLIGFFSLLQPFGFIASNLLGNKKHWTVWSRINWTVIYNVTVDSLCVPDKTGLVLALGSIVELSTSGPPVNTGCPWSLTRSKGGASQAKRHRAWAGGNLWRFYGGSQSSSGFTQMTSFSQTSVLTLFGFMKLSVDKSQWAGWLWLLQIVLSFHCILTVTAQSQSFV